MIMSLKVQLVVKADTAILGAMSSTRIILASDLPGSCSLGSYLLDSLMLLLLLLLLMLLLLLFCTNCSSTP
jgi:hypothetical protein